MRLQATGVERRTAGLCSHDLMREELAQALHEALYELEALPRNQDAALIGLYAVMDDLRHALNRTEALDLPQRRH